MEATTMVFGFIATAVLGLIVASILAIRIKSKDAGTERMREISGNIRQGAFAYLKRQYYVLVIFALAVGIILTVFVGSLTALAFVCGAFCSALAGFLGMNSATHANVRTTAAARKSVSEALKIEPGFSDAKTAISLINDYNNQFHKSVQEIEKKIEEDSKNPNLFFQLGTLYEQRKNFDQAYRHRCCVGLVGRPTD